MYWFWHDEPLQSRRFAKNSKFPPLLYCYRYYYSIFNLLFIRDRPNESTVFSFPDLAIEYPAI